MPLSSKQKEIFGINITLAILATIAVAGRFWARRVINAKLWWDDWTILAAVILCYGSIAHAVVGINLGLGIPYAYAHIQDFLKGGLVYFCLYIVTLATIKFSVLLMYYRIFKVASFKLAVIIVSSIVAVWAIIAFFFTLFECTPVSDFWSLDVSKTHCIDRLMLFDATAASNTILDIMILSLPVPMVLKLQLSLSKRIQLLLTFMLGTFVCIISIIRLVAVVTQDVHNISPTTEEVADYIWTTTETYVAVISACLPTYRPFVTNTSGFFSRLYGSRSKSTKDSKGSSSGDKPSTGNSWPSKRLPSQENDSSYEEDQGPLVGYQAAVVRNQEVANTGKAGDRRFVQDIEMQRPAGVIKVEQSWGNRWERN